jgi:translation elongation factor EF-Tu-like GTPase
MIQFGLQKLELMEADSWIEEPIRDTKPFLMPVEDVFTITRGTVLQVVSKQVLLIQVMLLKSLVWELKN